LIIPLIIQTIRLDRTGQDAVDAAPDLSSAEATGTDVLDAEHQSTDLAVKSSLRGQHTRLVVLPLDAPRQVGE